MRVLVAVAIPTIVMSASLFVESRAQQETQQETQQEKEELSGSTLIVGAGPDWKKLTESDFENVNCTEKTWQWKDDLLVCNGDCLGGYRTKSQYKNFEMLLDWKHLTYAGNSGVFVWAPKDVLDSLAPGALPQGIELQILDHGYAENWEKSKGEKSDWFTTHGDVFPCGVAKMTPFEPAAPNGQRSFPSAEHSKGFGQWNTYYIRAINGEVRLWVNGHEVSGGKDCSPASGFVCLEAEGAPIEFRNIRIRELP